ncbi:hypothetical protein SAMN05421821_109109 [Mucilaginibacter lappiensis]|uniref:Natural product n=1 Tax=Mucilaginibacter lappiensis TaxID=354630 RepID=A0ABR6PM82_9SPHI|nr:hypothetical protein [Mucilaginibacter lappiensis]MBB6110877.1 hypothetical protein [Mucilaginibacter lappiensis]SIR61643.1 hypothetical protein SAMN05421821_109109 [Mucilaginibacter lappiensis]
MKKLKLKAQELNVNEVLTREQLKKVSGGGSNCVKDKAPCEWFTPCCHVCAGVYCGDI